MEGEMSGKLDLFKQNTWAADRMGGQSITV